MEYKSLYKERPMEKLINWLVDKFNVESQRPFVRNYDAPKPRTIRAGFEELHAKLTGTPDPSKRLN